MKRFIQAWQRFDANSVRWVFWNGPYALVMIAMLTVLLLPAQAQKGRLRILAQTGGGHSATLTWILSTDDTATACTTSANCSQNVYRASGGCTNSFTLLTTTPLAAATAQYIDSTVTPGVWCYGVTFSINGLESAKDTASVTLQPASPTGASATAH